MKVTLKDFKNAVIMFEGKLVDQTGEVTNKSALAMAFCWFAPKIDEAIASVSVDGMVDVGFVKTLIEAGIRGSGCGKLVLVPQIPDWARRLGVTIKEISVSSEEAEEFFTKTIPAVCPSAIE